MLADFDSLRQLPIATKLQVIELLWDDIAASGEQLPLHEWQRKEAERRDAELTADPSKAIGRDDLWRRVNDACR